MPMPMGATYCMEVPLRMDDLECSSRYEHSLIRPSG